MAPQIFVATLIFLPSTFIEKSVILLALIPFILADVLDNLITFYSSLKGLIEKVVCNPVNEKYARDKTTQVR